MLRAVIRALALRLRVAGTPPVRLLLPLLLITIVIPLNGCGRAFHTPALEETSPREASLRSGGYLVLLRTAGTATDGETESLAPEARGKAVLLAERLRPLAAPFDEVLATPDPAALETAELVFGRVVGDPRLSLEDENSREAPPTELQQLLLSPPGEDTHRALVGGKALFKALKLEPPNPGEALVLLPRGDGAEVVGHLHDLLEDDP